MMTMDKGSHWTAQGCRMEAPWISQLTAILIIVKHGLRYYKIFVVGGRRMGHLGWAAAPIWLQSHSETAES